MKPIKALLALFACAFLPLHAASLADLSYTNAKVTITYCDRAATGELVIPDTIGAYPVTSIGNDSFRGCTNLTSITIPDSVTSIEAFAFRDCTSLTSITIGNGVTSIGVGAFFQCTSLTSITIPDSVTSIESRAFQNCTSLTSITIGNGVTSIGTFAFYGCTSLTSITIGNGVTSIGYYAFWDCTSLTSITIPDSVTSIESYAFQNCTSLTSITIGNGVTSIGDFAFIDCTSLTSITIPDSVTSIGKGAFYKCTSLTSIIFQGVAPAVGIDAFSNTPDGAVAYVTIENQASFGGFGQKWNRLTVSNSIDVIDLTWTTTDGEVTITDCDEAATGGLVIPATIGGNPVTSIGDDAFRDCTSLTSIKIPDGVTSIGGNAFRDCSSLTSITIPDGVTSIGAYTFFDCTSLPNIIFQGDAPSVGFKAFSRVANGAVALVTIEALSSFGASGDDWQDLTVEPILTWTTTDGEVTITDCNEAATGELVIPNTIGGNAVTSIGANTFNTCTSLTSITIPNSVTSIGGNAFRGCTNLTSITIGSGVTSIGGYAFRGCTSLTSITIPDGVTNIGRETFRSCTSLTSITIPNSVARIETFAFYGCTSLTSIIFQGVAPTVGIDAFSNTPDGAVAVVSIEDQASFGDLGADWNGLTVSMSVSDMITALNAQNAAVATARTAGRGDVTNDPTSYNLVTQTSYNTVIAERDARPTIGEVKDARLGSVVLQPDAANQRVKIRFSIEETDDFRNWTKRDEINEITVPLEVGKRFYRFALEDE